MKPPVLFGMIPILALLGAGQAFPVSPTGEPEVVIRSLEERGGSLFLEASLEAPLDDTSRDALEGGVPISFRWIVQLEKPGGVFRGRRVRSAELLHTLRFDPVRRLYLFTASGYPAPVARDTPDGEEAMGWMRRVAFPLYPAASLRAGIRYRVRVKAILRSAEPPTGLGALLFLNALFDKETAWIEQTVEKP